jgi:hypothetical protein
LEAEDFGFLGARSAARPQFAIGGVDDGIGHNRRNVALDDLNPAGSRVWHGALLHSFCRRSKLKTS